MALSVASANPWRDALKQAVTELEQAERAFQWADPDYCDYTVYRILAAREKIALVLHQARAAYGITSHPMIAAPQAQGAITTAWEGPSGEEAPPL